MLIITKMTTEDKISTNQENQNIPCTSCKLQQDAIMSQYHKTLNTYCLTISRTSLRRLICFASWSHSVVILPCSYSRFTTKSFSYFNLPQMYIAKTITNFVNKNMPTTWQCVTTRPWHSNVCFVLITWRWPAVPIGPYLTTVLQSIYDTYCHQTMLKRMLLVAFAAFPVNHVFNIHEQNSMKMSTYAHTNSFVANQLTRTNHVSYSVGILQQLSQIYVKPAGTKQRLC